MTTPWLFLMEQAERVSSDNPLIFPKRNGWGTASGDHPPLALPEGNGRQAVKSQWSFLKGTAVGRWAVTTPWSFPKGMAGEGQEVTIP